MMSKERVLAVLHGRQPDRVPINFAGANLDIDRRLREYFGLDKDDNEGLLKALNVDFRVVGVPYTGPQLHRPAEGKHVDPLWGIHTRWAQNESGGYWDFCDFLLQKASLEEIESWPMPSPDDFDYRVVKDQCDRYENYCVVYGNPGFGDIINSTGMIRTMEQVLIDLVTDDPAGLRYIERKVAIQAEILNRVLDAADGRIDLVWIGEDLGTQNSPMVSLDIFRKHIRPNHQKLIDIAKAHGNLPVMIHSCGSSSWAFNDFIEMGINVVDTLQPEAANMSPHYLKENYGGRLCFNGCISTAGPMAYGTRQETIDCVKKIFDIMTPGGGYIMAPTHMLQDNSPTENVIAAYETALHYGRY
jgi:hypothetical protein